MYNIVAYRLVELVSKGESVFFFFCLLIESHHRLLLTMHFLTLHTIHTKSNTTNKGVNALNYNNCTRQVTFFSFMSTIRKAHHSSHIYMNCSYSNLIKTQLELIF